MSTSQRYFPMAGFGLLWVLLFTLDSHAQVVGNIQTKQANSSATDKSASIDVKENNFSTAKGGKYRRAGKRSFMHQVAVEVEARHSDNGARTASHEVAEWQDQTSLYWNLGYQSPVLAINSNYQWQQVNFSENTQEDENYLLGDSLITVNDTSQAIGITAGHNQRRLLQSADASDVSSNKEDRRVLYATPFSKIELTPRDHIRLTYDYRDLDYEIRNEYDYVQETASADYHHLLNKITGVVVNLSQTQQSYKENDYYDYDILRSSVSVWRNLRRLNYRLVYGVNKVKTLGGEKTQPLYGFSMAYQHGGFYQSLKYDHYITDVSESSLDHSLLFGPDWQIYNLGSQSVNRERLHLHFAGEIFSPTTRIIIDWIREQDDYISVGEEQQTEIYSGSIEHKLNRRHQIYGRVHHVDRDALRNIFQNDSTYYRYEVGYQYHWLRFSDVTFYASDVGRTRDTLSLYDEKVIGLRIYHQFL